MSSSTPNTSNKGGTTGLVVEHDLRSLLRLNRDDIFYNLNVHQIGRVEAFYADSQTADISLPIQRFLEGKALDLPLLVKCPVFFLTGGVQGAITMPVAKGDTCLVLFNDRDMDSWWTTGSAGVPVSRRAHDMSDALAIVGFRHKGNARSDYHATNIEILNLGGKVSVGEKLKVENASTSLKTVLEALINAIKAQVDTHGDTLTSGTKTALDNVKTQLGTLLE